MQATTSTAVILPAENFCLEARYVVRVAWYKYPEQDWMDKLYIKHIMKLSNYYLV